MNLKTLSSEGKIAYLIKPILKVLQEAGGQLERSEIKERIKTLNAYSLKGYQLIHEFPLEEKPTTKEEFLEAFNVALQKYHK